MSEEKILVPTEKGLVEGKVFEGVLLFETLENVLNEGYRPVFMPELINTYLRLPANSPLWEKGYLSGSGRYTGKYQGKGKTEVVITHKNHYFSDPENIKKSTTIDYAAPGRMFLGGNLEASIPQDEFDKLRDSVDNEDTYAFDYEQTKELSGQVKLEEVIFSNLFVSSFGSSAAAMQYSIKLYQMNKKEVWLSNQYTGSELGTGMPNGQLLGFVNFSVYPALLPSARILGIKDQ